MQRRKGVDGSVPNGEIPAPSTSLKNRTNGLQMGRFMRRKPILSVLIFVVSSTTLFFTIGLLRTIFWHNDDDTSLHRAALHKAFNISSSFMYGHGGAGRYNASCIRLLPKGRFGAGEEGACVTKEYFFDMAIGEEKIGRFHISTFGLANPKAAANFHGFTTCSAEVGFQARCYKGDGFHRVVPGFVIQGGSKGTGSSIYGMHTFREEVSEGHHSVFSHSEIGAVSYAEYPIGSQFFILTRDEAKYLDNNHVVLGYISKGMEVVKKIEHTPLNKESPLQKVTIEDCGEVTGY